MPRPPYPCAECWRPVPWYERLHRIGVRAYVCEPCYQIRKGTYQLPLLATGLDVITGEDEAIGESEVVSIEADQKSEG